MDNGRRGIRRVFTLLAIAFAAALVWIALTTFWMWRYQERVVFQPPGVNAEAPASAVRVRYPASDGHELFGYLVAPRDVREPSARSVAGGTLVIAFHGNADLAAWLVPWAQELASRSGAHVLAPEYRGYAGIGGLPSYAAAASDAMGALAFARDQLRPARLILFGHSLGSAVASDVAATMRDAPPDALVLQSPFTSAREMAARMLVPPIPWLWGRISRVHYDTRAIVANVDAPVFVAHGTRDVVIPTRMGRQVFAAAKRPGELLLVDGAGHNDVADVAGERYWRWITNAVRGSGSRLATPGSHEPLRVNPD